MMTVIQQTMAGFTRSASRRMDAELCLLNLCQPELNLDAKALNARLTKLEEKLRTGDFVQPIRTQPAATVASVEEEEEELPPPPDDQDAPPEENTQQDSTPIGFWTDLASGIRQELRPPISGFFAPTPNAPVQGVVYGDTVVLQCANAFTMDMVNKPQVLELVARKASAMLARPVTVTVVDASAAPQKSEKMDQLLSFGRAHSNVIKIKE